MIELNRNNLTQYFKKAVHSSRNNLVPEFILIESDEKTKQFLSNQLSSHRIDVYSPQNSEDALFIMNNYNRYLKGIFVGRNTNTELLAQFVNMRYLKKLNIPVIVLTNATFSLH